jgi:mono/diheme cytochrome c family protein
MLNAVFSTLAVLGSTWVAGCASVSHVPYPTVQANTSPEAVKRGESLFRGSCEACHRNPESQRAAGNQLKEVPPSYGTFYAANLTAHPTAGIGAVKDEALARVIRYGVSRDNRLTVMPSSRMSDEDLAAVLGFIRSGHPLFEADANPAPRSKFGFFAGLLFPMMVDVPNYPASGMKAPPKGTLEYGRYMADVLDCTTCHTKDPVAEDGSGKDLYGGGFEFVGADGNTLYSSNITPDATGIHGWSYEDFSRAVRDGLAPGGLVRWPMPRFRSVEEEDLKAIYEYLRTVQPVKKEIPGAKPRLTPSAASEVKLAPQASRSTVALEPGALQRTAAPVELVTGVVLGQAEVDAAALFTRLGCSVCHAAGARYHDKIQRAVDKSEQELALWIRNPEKFIPGTPMPTYASMVDEPTALALARWLKAGGPGAPTAKK